MSRRALPWVLVPLATLVLTLVIAGAALAEFGVVHTYRVAGAGMEPTLRCARPTPGCSGSSADRVLAIDSSVSRGDIVVFDPPPEATVRCGSSGPCIKRIVGLPGERVEERRGVVFVDGRRLDEPYVVRRDSRTVAAKRVPSDSYFVLGDDRASSCDSRDWGPLSSYDLIARVRFVYWPPRRISFR